MESGVSLPREPWFTDSRGPAAPAGGGRSAQPRARGSPRPRPAPPPGASPSGADRRIPAGEPWRCASGRSAGALSSGLACCSSGTPSRRKCDVLNRGFSGYNTRWAKIILPRLIRKGSGMENPVVVTIFFGANDCSLKDENPKQHVPLDEYSANLRDMVQYLRSVDIPGERIILITPPPLYEAAWEKECTLKGCKLNRLHSVAGEYANACLTVARDCGTDVLDLWTLMQKDKQDFSSYLSDGLHLSPMGNEFLFSNLWPLLVKKVSSLPWLLPYWKDVEEAKPELSLLGDGDH
ncbi:isoamyl acetate-hydrolyzing esterase 1 homolog isoform X5 [Onychomys torridus]|uniref:isoamyl acetate-hydrolyzing esterase 1 homolog isoform X5 n=1 Tax=Onychomys torridus TaxID=38674 RepID=UPI00167F7F57|nr:isoamyl acetate-hydrolyzing esterase 1 homolog isoform X5 [Onychomys torridus]